MGIGRLNHQYSVSWGRCFNHLNRIAEVGNRVAKVVGTDLMEVERDLDALGAIYVFKNGIDRSDAEPWGGGPFGFQIDIVDSVPDDQAYTPLRRPYVVTWAEDADARVLRSVEELMAAQDAGELEITPTDVVVTAPIVSWPGDPFGDASEANENSG